MTKAAILLTNAMIFDGSGAGLFPGEVLVEGERIVAVARGSGQIARDRAGKVIDAAARP
jgi:N-acyl-D-aspartate/D-glutamate deacylase